MKVEFLAKNEILLYERNVLMNMTITSGNPVAPYITKLEANSSSITVAWKSDGNNQTYSINVNQEIMQLHKTKPKSGNTDKGMEFEVTFGPLVINTTYHIVLTASNRLGSNSTIRNITTKPEGPEGHGKYE